MVLPLVTMWVEISLGERPRDVRARCTMTPEERPSASLSGTSNVGLPDWALFTRLVQLDNVKSFWEARRTIHL